MKITKMSCQISLLTSVEFPKACLQLDIISLLTEHNRILFSKYNTKLEALDGHCLANTD